MIGNSKDLKGVEFISSEAKSTSMKALVSPKEGWEGYVMREVEVGVNGYTPKHSHPWPHINYILKGVGEILIDGKINKVSTGSYAYIPSNSLHQFRNIGSETFKFICIVPEVGHVY